MSAKPKLYQYAACPFCNKVSALLAYKGVEYDVVEVNPLNKKEIEFSENYKKVPIYISAEGREIHESNEIMKTIDQDYPEKKVFREDEAGQAQNEKWLTWSEGLVQGLPTVVYGKLGDSIRAFDYITKTGNFSWMQKRMIKYSGAMIMNLVAKKVKKREEIEDPEQFLTAKIKEWSDGLAGKEFMGGNEPIAADIAVFGITRAVADLNAGEIFKKNAEFWNWFERMLKATSLSVALV